MVLRHPARFGLNEGAADVETPGQPVSLVTRDQVKLTASFFPADDLSTRRPALILLHGNNSSKERWHEVGFVERLAEDNYHILTIDIRGRGGSETGDVVALQKNPGLGVYDIEAGLAWIQKQPGVDTDRIALVGSSYGANLVVAGCLTQSWKIHTVICFSATAAAYPMRDALGGESQIPSGLYLGGSQELERYQVPATAERLVADTKARSKVRIFDDPAHALVIWQRFPESQELVTGWLSEQFAQ